MVFINYLIFIIMKELYLEAVKALECYHKNHPSVFDEFGRYQGERIWVQPSEFESEIGRKYVYLRNINGLLAKYDIKKRRIII